jgi:PhnB protein
MATRRSAPAKKAAAKKTPARKPAPAQRVASPAAKKSARKPAPKAKPKKAAPIPKGFHTLTPYLVVRGAKQALEFYARAFGARSKGVIAMPDGSVMHAELQIGDSMLMLSEENPEWGSKSPLLLGGSAAHVMVYARDVDAFMARAAQAGATITMPASDMFWGDRYGKLKDPFGHEWSIGTHLEDMSQKELQRRSDAWAKEMMAGGAKTG